MKSNSVIEVDRELFHQMMRRLSGTNNEIQPDSVHIEIRETAFRLAKATAAQSGTPVTISLGAA